MSHLRGPQWGFPLYLKKNPQIATITRLPSFWGWLVLESHYGLQGGTVANPTVVALYIENVQGPLCSQKGPFWDQTNSFACFLQMGGSISGPEGAGGTKVQFRCNSLRQLDNKYLATTFIPYSFSLAFIKILLFFL